MALIDRDSLVIHCRMYLPNSVNLTDEMILLLAGTVITKVGDDDTKFPEILCKTLYACGNKCLADSLVDSSNLKKERTFNVELEYHNRNGKSVWKDWVANLKNVCPLFGYSPDTSTTRQSLVKAIDYNSPNSPLYPLVDCSSSNTMGTIQDFLL